MNKTILISLALCLIFFYGCTEVVNEVPPGPKPVIVAIEKDNFSTAWKSCGNDVQYYIAFSDSIYNPPHLYAEDTIVYEMDSLLDTIITMGKDTSYTITDLFPGTTYYFNVYSFWVDFTPNPLFNFSEVFTVTTLTDD